MGRPKRLGDSTSSRTRHTALISLLQSIEEVAPFVLEDLRRDVLPRIRQIADRANGGIKQIQSKLTATKSRYRQWALRYNLVCPDLEKAVVLAATVDHLELSVPDTPAHIIQGIGVHHDEAPIVLGEYLDRGGNPFYSRDPTFTELFGTTHLNLPPRKKFKVECSEFNPQLQTPDEWMIEVRECFEAAMQEHVLAPGRQGVEHLTIRAPDYFKWTALYLCGRRGDGSGFGWSDREIAEHNLQLNGTEAEETRKALLRSRREQVKKGRTKIMKLLGMQQRPPSSRPGRPSQPPRG